MVVFDSSVEEDFIKTMEFREVDERQDKKKLLPKKFSNSIQKIVNFTEVMNHFGVEYDDTVEQTIA